MILPFPDEPRSSEHATGEVPVRYEDIAQDGRLKLNALPQALGQVCWMDLLRRHPVTRIARTEGIVPILSRLVIEGGVGPLSVRRALEARGTYELGHTVDATGGVNRLMLALWMDAHGAAERTHGPPPPNHGERIRAGRVFAEHVFTRLFAPPEERKVLRFEGIEGLPEVPSARYEWRAGEALLALPEGAEPLDGDLEDDAVTTAFGLAHTDSNQHVNSLEYPRLFEEAALRRLSARGLGSDLLMRHVELAYRKPCFAGDRVRVRLRTFTMGGTPGAVLALVPADAPAARPYCYGRLTF